MKLVGPDGPMKCGIAYLAESPGEREELEGVGLVGATGRKLWSMCQESGLPHRPLDGLRVLPEPAPDAWVGNVMQERPRVELKGRELDKQLAAWSPRLKLPHAQVYLAIGDLACRALISGRLPRKYQSVLHHCAAVWPASAVRGTVKVPNQDAKVVAMRHPAALLRGEDAWRPSCMLALNRAKQVLDGRLPVEPPYKFVLHASIERDMPDLLQAAKDAGAYAFDLETPVEEQPVKVLVGSFCVGDRVWVFGGEEAVEAARRLFTLPVRCIGQNLNTFDLPVLWRNGLRLPAGPVFDTRWVDAAARPRLLHNLAHMAAHWLPWGPPNWKHLSHGVPTVSEQGRHYCALDSLMAWRIAVEQQKRMAPQSIALREDIAPVVASCASLGVRCDVIERDRLRRELSDAFVELGSLPEVQRWAATVREPAEAALEAWTLTWRAYADAVALHKGAALRMDLNVTVEEAKAKRDECKAKVDELRTRIAAHTNVRPTQTDILREYLFKHLCLRPPPGRKRTKTGKVKIGRKELDSLYWSADVQKRLAGGEEELLVLRRISDASRIGSLLGLHLGVSTKGGVPDLARDTQLRDGRLPVIYNPVQFRFSAGKSPANDPEHQGLAMQVHNVTSRLVVSLPSGQREWNLRTQFIPDDPAAQMLLAVDWRSMEAFVMAWQAGARLGYWDWLHDLEAGVDLHSAAADIVLPGLPVRWSPDGGKKWHEPPVPAIPAGSHKKFRLRIAGRDDCARDWGKKANHALTLGATKKMLLEQYDIPLPLGGQMLTAFLSSPRGQVLQRLHQHIEQEVLDTGKVTMPFWGEAVDFWAFERRGNERRAKRPNRVYAPAQQGPSAIIMQLCLAPVDRVARDCGGRLLLSTHDEMVVCVKAGRLAEAQERVSAIMTRPWKEMPCDGGRWLSIPVSAASGANWGECK